MTLSCNAFFLYLIGLFINKTLILMSDRINSSILESEDPLDVDFMCVIRNYLGQSNTKMIMTTSNNVVSRENYS